MLSSGTMPSLSPTLVPSYPVIMFGLRVGIPLHRFTASPVVEATYCRRVEPGLKEEFCLDPPWLIDDSETFTMLRILKAQWQSKGLQYLDWEDYIPEERSLIPSSFVAPCLCEVSQSLQYV